MFVRALLLAVFPVVTLAGCSPKTEYSYEFKPLVQSPDASKKQAELICSGEANVAAKEVEIAYSGGGFAGGLIGAGEAASVRRNVEQSCLARLGWEKVRLSG